MNSNQKTGKVEYAIVCDDVRREDNGKMIIIGVYASDIGLPKFPARIRVHLLVAIRSITGGPLSVWVRIKDKNKVLFENKNPVNFPAGKDQLSMFGLGQIPLEIKDETTLDFQIKLGQGRFQSITKILAHKDAT